MVEYWKFDDRLANPTRLPKIQFALDMWYKHFTEMLHEKHKEGLTGGKISKWIHDNTDTLTVSTTSIEYTLRIMGVFEYYTKARGEFNSPNFNSKGVGTKTAFIKPDVVSKKKMCSCCGIQYVSAGNRFLCSKCYLTRG